MKRVPISLPEDDEDYVDYGPYVLKRVPAPVANDDSYVLKRIPSFVPDEGQYDDVDFDDSDRERYDDYLLARSDLDEAESGYEFAPDAVAEVDAEIAPETIPAVAQMSAAEEAEVALDE